MTLNGIIKYLKEHNIEKNNNDPGKTQFYVSDNPEKFKKLGAEFLNNTIINVSLIEL